MNILHYTLGLPPYRSGGLTRYTTDLMLSQRANGDSVSLLYPGSISLIRSNSFIIENQDYSDIKVFELINSSIIPLFHGIKSPKSIFSYTKKIDIEELDRFYKKIKPEVFHIHTLMGLPMELLAYMKSRGVRIIYTSHDYYGLCPKVNFINNKNELCSKASGLNCASCNINSPSNLFLRIRNSQLVHRFKSHIKPKRKLNKLPTSLHQTRSINIPNDIIANYTTLLDYYKSLFSYIDQFHFNSSVSSEVYNSYLKINKSTVLSITHAGIRDNRTSKIVDKSLIKFAFIGSTDQYKGFPILRNALLELERQGVVNWQLLVYGGVEGTDNDTTRIKYLGKFNSSNISEVYNSIDCLIVPSIWKETFSLIALEALSYGIPVLVSNNVGAKDILNKYGFNYVFEPNISSIVKDLESILTDVNILTRYQSNILELEFDHIIESHIEDIKKMYLID